MAGPIPQGGHKKKSQGKNIVSASAAHGVYNNVGLLLKCGRTGKYWFTTK